MTVIRMRGIKRFKSKGKWYAYHRKTGTRLKAELGTGAFFAEVAALDAKQNPPSAIPGTLGMLFKSYRASQDFTRLRDRTRKSYREIMDILQPLDAMPLVELTSPFIAKLRDKIAAERGRRTANYIMAVISIAAVHGVEMGFIASNPVKGVRRVRPDRDAPTANRPWTQEERVAVLDGLPAHLRPPVALAMFTGLRKGDVLALKRDAICEGMIWRKTGKTGQEVSLPVHPDLAALLAAAPKHDSITICANLYGRPWTISGFDTVFGRAMCRFEEAGMVGSGLTFHGLRHTVGGLLREITDDLDLIRRWLGQKTLHMAIHYSDRADTSKQMGAIVENFDPLGTKPGAKRRTRSV